MLKKGINVKFGSLTVSSERSKRPASNAGAAHAVKKGDTLYSIAKKYGVSVADIVKANNIKNNHIEIPSKEKLLLLSSYREKLNIIRKKNPYLRKPSGNYKFADRFRYRNNGIYNNDIMKKWLSLIILLAVNVISINAQQKNSINNQSMEKKTKTIRLIYPQWQGGDIARWITEIKDPEAASKGYFLGAELLNFLAPDSSQETLTVPISTEITERRKKDGVLDRDIIVKQTKAALDLLRISDPDKIVTLGGECSVSVVPFTYLAEKYKDNVAMIWIDAHPDITLPGDMYSGFHAMAVTACMGKGDKEILSKLPAPIAPSKILLVGLRDWERDEIKVRQKQYGIKHLTPEDVAQNSNAIYEWLKSCGASRVLIHFDMDVLDPAEIIAAVGVVPDGMKLAEVVRVINDIAKEKEIVGLTVAEPMPRIAIRIKEMLNQLPLLK